MTFSESIKKHTEEKHMKLLSGDAERTTTNLEILSLDEYVKKNREFHQRLKAQEDAVNNALQSIKDKKLQEQNAANEKRKREDAARQQKLNKIKRQKDKKKKTILSIAIVAFLIFAILFGIISNNVKYSANNVDISVLAKNIDESFYNNLEFTLVLEVKNKGSLDILQLVGNFKIYNSNGDCLLADTLTLNGNIKPDNMLQFNVDLNLSDTDKTREIYETDLSGLKMTYQITTIRFENYKEKEYKNSDEKILCDVLDEYVEGVKTNDKTYQNAIDLFDQGEYAKASSLFKELGDYKDSSEYYIKAMYKNALDLYSKEKFGEAYKSMNEIYGYEDSSEKMSEIASTALEKAESFAAKGDYVSAYKLVEQVGYDENSTLYQAYQNASEGNFPEAVELGLTVVFIPDGEEVIPDYYFKVDHGTNQIKKVILPSTLKSIGICAFDGCSKLTEINLPEGLKTIGNYAFANCKALKSIEIPNTVESMGFSVFGGCINLKTASIPSSLKTIPSGIFTNCSSLTTVTIKSGTEVIDIGAFAGCTSLINITLPDSLKEIHSSAFNKCTNLTEITIPSTVTLIEYSAFYDCSALQRVYFEEQDGWEYNYGTKLDVGDAQKNAKELKRVDVSTWERK